MSGNRSLRDTMTGRLASMTWRVVLAVGLASLAGAQSSAAAPTPQLGRTVVVTPVSGTVLVKQKGDRRFGRLPESPTLVRLGAELDATRGRVRVRAASGRAGSFNQGTVSEGVFSITQERREGITVLRLLGGDAGACQTAAATSGVSTSPDARLLVAAGAGFETRGHYGETLTQERGTKWLMEDRCDGTYTTVKSGAVQADANGHLSLRVQAEQIVRHFCGFDGAGTVSRAFCTMGIYSAELGVWGAGLINDGDVTSYELCATNPAGEERCETYPLSEPFGNSLRDSVVTCVSDSGPGAYSVRWLISGVQLGPAFNFTSNEPPGQGCQHRP